MKPFFVSTDSILTFKHSLCCICIYVVLCCIRVNLLIAVFLNDSYGVVSTDLITLCLYIYLFVYQSVYRHLLDRL